MTSQQLNATIHAIIENVAVLVPAYMQIEADRKKANGNVAICLIAPDGQVYGRIFGADKIKGREAFRVAWVKASQVWITGVKTGEYERQVFTNEREEDLAGIRKPDYIGWEGGQPVALTDGTLISAGFSGFRSVTDLEIVTRALAQLPDLNSDGKPKEDYQLIE